MKRSEMLLKIRKYIELIRGVDNGYYVYPEDELFCEYILNAVEGAGMQPPAYYDPFFDDEPECDGMISEWERE